MKKRFLIGFYFFVIGCVSPICGDGEANTATEECDDANTASNDGCSSVCLIEFCGDSAVNNSTQEQCDDGNAASGDGCSSACLTEFCGDGTLNNSGLEQCDDGVANSDTTPDACRTDCTTPFCGDGVVDSEAGEECDDNNTNDGDGCGSACLAEFCGDGTVNNSAEECDDNNAQGGDGCDPLCQREPICNDGFIDAPETCEDGNQDAGDGCDALCLEEFCGDGIINNTFGGVATEACDDGSNNANTPDACRLTCTLPVCGDLIVDTGEECDDGNTLDADGCDTDCTTTRMVQVATGQFHSCALTEFGAIKCWGNGGFGLGYGNLSTIGDNETPASVGTVEVGGTISHFATSANHTCALLTGGSVTCWGNGGNGRLGYGNVQSIGDNETPASVGIIDVGDTVAQISTGFFHTCALLTDGNVKCWGEADRGQLGYGNLNDIGDNETPASIGTVDVGGPVAQISTGTVHTCALLTDGNVTCWGSSADGRLGYGNLTQIGDNETPASAGVVDIGGAAVQVAAGAFHTCALLTDGNVVCWGSGFHLGYGNLQDIGDDETPASAGPVDIGGAVSQISTGDNHMCALLTDGNVKCWGDGLFGRLGYGNSFDIGDNGTPSGVGVVNVGAPVIQISAGGSHTCALLVSGNVKCWGNGGSGQLGYGNTTNIGDNETPVSVGTINFFP